MWVCVWGGGEREREMGALRRGIDSSLQDDIVIGLDI